MNQLSFPRTALELHILLLLKIEHYYIYILFVWDVYWRYIFDDIFVALHGKRCRMS